MLASRIERMEFSKVKSLVTLEREELANKAKRLLGYSKLADVIIAPGSLFNTLRNLEITALDYTSVKMYKKSKERTGMYSGTKRMLVWLATWLFLVLIVGPEAARYANWGVVSPGGVIAVGSWMVGWFGLLCWISLSTFAKPNSSWGEGNRKVIGWNAESVSNYHGSIPEHVLRKAIQIQEQLPVVTFNVEYLTETTQHYRKPLPDPFLKVSLGSESYYIEVWDEKEYERTL